jgi:hypothetical protein
MGGSAASDDAGTAGGTAAGGGAVCALAPSARTSVRKTGSSEVEKKLDIRFIACVR